MKKIIKLEKDEVATIQGDTIVIVKKIATVNSDVRKGFVFVGKIPQVEESIRVKLDELQMRVNKALESCNQEKGGNENVKSDSR